MSACLIPALLGSLAPPDIANRISRVRTSRRRPQPFTGARKVAVQAAAADSSEAPKDQARQQQRRPPRAVTVQLATIQPGQEYDGTVVRRADGGRECSGVGGRRLAARN
jgi:hypothetical protein